MGIFDKFKKDTSGKKYTEFSDRMDQRVTNAKQGIKTAYIRSKAKYDSKEGVAYRQKAGKQVGSLANKATGFIKTQARRSGSRLSYGGKRLFFQ